MTTLLERAWSAARERASGVESSEGGLHLIRIDDSSRWGCFGGVDDHNHVLLAVEVATRPPLIPLQSNALDYFRIERRASTSWLMVIRLKTRDLDSVFERLCQDLIDRVCRVADSEEVIRIVRTRISLWKKLFDENESGVLAEFRVKGLIVELLFLESKVAQDKSPSGCLESVTAWVGPTGADQDFVFSDHAVEVKAIGPSSEGVSISSLQQLSSPLPLTLHVRTVRKASPESPAAVTLNDLVSRIEATVSKEPTALHAFKDALISAGYVTNPHYDTVAFEPMLVEDFRVDQDFPRLTPQGVPVGISTATYVVSLRAIRGLS